MINHYKIFILDINIVNILYFIILIAVFLFVSEILKKIRINISSEILRKIPHILIGLLFAITPYFLNINEIFILSIILFIGVFINNYMNIFKAVFSIKRTSFGIFLMPVSLFISAYLFLPEHPIVFSVGFFVLALADAFAALAGKTCTIFLLSTKKTLRGTMVFFITTFLILLFGSFYHADISIIKILFSSIILAALEFFTIFGLDNIVLPIAASYLFLLL